MNYADIINAINRIEGALKVAEIKLAQNACSHIWHKKTFDVTTFYQCEKCGGWTQNIKLATNDTRNKTEDS